VAKKGRDKRRPSVADVLAGRVRASADSLFQLIHEVNPTGKSLSPQAAAQDYAVKGRLQCLLIRDYRDELSIAVDPSDPRVIAIRHRHGPEDACHAVVDDLDEEARSWVRRKLDEDGLDAPGLPTPTPSGKPPSNPSIAIEGSTGVDPDSGDWRALLAQGRHALEAFDYELAESRLREALVESGGAEEVALPLLELLVDVLAQYADGLAVDADLPARTRKSDAVSAVVAEAAARATNWDVANARVAGIQGLRAATAYYLLGRHDLERGDLAEAERHLGLARDSILAVGDPALATDLETLARAIGARRKEERRPAEDALVAAFETGNVELARQLCSELLVRWPASRAAKEVKAKLDQQGLLADVARLVAAGEAHLAAAEYDRAAAMFANASRLNPGAHELADLHERATRLADEQRTEREAAAVVRLLADLDPRPGLLRFVEASAAVQMAVQKSRTDTRFDWLRRMPAGGTARANAAVDAVLAVGAAEQALERFDPRVALEMLDRHWQLLAGLSAAVELRARAIAQETRALELDARDRLSRAETALVEGKPSLASELLASIRHARLSPALSNEVSTLAARLGALEELETLARRYARLREAGDLFSARDTAKALLARCAADDRSRWADRQAELDQEIRKHWQVRPVSGADVARLDLRDVDVHAGFTENVALGPGGRELAVAGVHGTAVFLRIVDAATGAVTAAASLRTPDPIGERPSVDFLDGRIWVVGPQAALCVAPVSWTIIFWALLPEIVGQYRDISRATVLGGGRYLWAEGELSNEDSMTVAIDLEKRAVVRRVKGAWAIDVARRGGSALVLCTSDDLTEVYEPSGAPARAPLPRTGQAEDLAFAPDGSGIVYLLKSKEVEDGSVPFAAIWFGLDGRRSEPCLLAGTHYEYVHQVASASVAGAIFVLAGNNDDTMRLFILQVRDATVEVVADCDLPNSCALFEDARGEHVVLGVVAGDRVSFQALGLAPPLLASGVVLHRRLPRFAWFVGCTGPSASESGGDIDLDRDVRKMTRKQRRQLLEQYKLAGDGKRLRRLGRAIEYDDEDMAREALQEAQRLAPASTRELLAEAESQATRGRWDEVVRLLTPLVGEHLPVPPTQHVFHALGAALLMAGRVPEALAILRRGVDCFPDGPCDLNPYLEIATPFSAPPKPEEWADDKPWLCQLVGAALAADHHRRSGEHFAALVAIDRPIVWRAAEIQTSARLASAYLMTAPSNGAERFFRAMAIERFAAIHRESETIKLAREYLPIPGAILDAVTLSDLAREGQIILTLPEAP
jgi:hypothetical protein